MPSFQIVTHPPLPFPLLLLLLLLLLLFNINFFLSHLVIRFSVPDNTTVSISNFDYEVLETVGIVIVSIILYFGFN